MTARKTTQKSASKKKPANKTTAKKPAAKKASGKKAPAKKASGKKAPAKKASGKKAPAKKASGKKQPARKISAKPAQAGATAQKPAPAKKKGPISAMDVNLGHVFKLRLNSTFRQVDFLTARQQLSEETYASIEEATRAIVDKALELTHDDGARHGRRRRGR
jgi:hypothetical protein